MHINPIYLMIAVTISSQLSFMVPISSFPTLIVKVMGTVTKKEMLKGGIGPKVVCFIFLLLTLETLGGLVFDLKTLPPWAEERLLLRTSLASRKTFAGMNNTIRDF